MIDRIFAQYFSELSHEELLAMLAKYKGKFNTRSGRMKLLEGKIQEVENDTHRATKVIQGMNDQLKGYHNKPDQTETGALPELDVEVIITMDVVYPIKNKDDTSSPSVIIFVDETEEIQDTVDTTGNDIKPVKETKQQPDIVGEQIAEEASTTKPSVDMQSPLIKDHIVESQLPPITTTAQEEQTETKKTEKKAEEKKDDEEKEKEKKKTDDNDDDSINIKGPIDMENLSASKLMEIATVMQSRA